MNLQQKKRKKHLLLKVIFLKIYNYTKNIYIIINCIYFKKRNFSSGKRGRPKAVSKEESEEVVSAEENGVADNDVDSKADKGGSSTEEEVDSKTEDKIENGNSSAEEEKKVEEVNDIPLFSLFNRMVNIY